VPAFMALHPAVTLDISHTDRIVDLMEERADVAIRAGPLKNSILIARKLGATGKIIVASPDYLSRHGRMKRHEGGHEWGQQ
ncbi:LysR substrate-binding domain-containing protein, partial [Rhizobium ruizarguesonis]